MTEAEDAPAGAQEPQKGPPATDPTPASTEPASEPQETPERDQTYSAEHVRELRAESKKHRLRFRESEEARAKLQARVDAADRREIERIAADRLNEPDDIWLVHQASDFRAEDGSLDEAAVQEALNQLVSSRPHWARPAPEFDGGVRRSAGQPPSFGDALKARVSGGT